MNITNTGKMLALLRNMLDTTKRTLSPVHFGEVKPALCPSDEKYFKRCAPEGCGIGSGYIKNYVTELIEDKTVGLQNIMIARGGRVIFEAAVNNRDLETPRATFSECKSIVSLAIGVLVTQGRLALNERITDIFGDKTSAMAKLKHKSVTVRQLLNMTACLSFNEFEAMVTRDWIKGYFNSDASGELGEDFRYNSLNSYILAAVVSKRSGMDFDKFLEKTLFGELEIKNYYWEKCPNGYSRGGWGLYIRPEDILKLGVLVMNRGVWNKKRLISAKYIAEATKTQSFPPEELGDFNYGYQIWCGRNSNSFLFNGVLGQNLLAYRENSLIIAVNCANGDLFQQNAFFKISDKYFNRSFPETIEADENAFNELNEFKSSLKRYCDKPQKSILSATTEKRDLDADLNAIDGYCFEVNSTNAASTGLAPLALQIIQGNYTKGLRSVSFKRNGETLEINFEERDENHLLTIGFGYGVHNAVLIHGEPFSVAAEGRFVINEDGVPVLVIECDFLETPHKRIIKFIFQSGFEKAIFTETPGYELAMNMPRLMLQLMPESVKLASAFSKFDGDYIKLKLENAFAPKLNLKNIEE